MSVQSVLLPLFVQVALTFVLLYALAIGRAREITAGRVQPADISLGQPGWPRRLTQLGNCFRNQLEVPVLFYVLTLLALATNKAGVVFVVLAWVFVLSRIVHAAVHVTSNDVRVRGPLYGLGVLVLTVMWVIFAAEILLAPVASS